MKAQLTCCLLLLIWWLVLGAAILVITGNISAHPGASSTHPPLDKGGETRVALAPGAPRYSEREPGTATGGSSAPLTSVDGREHPLEGAPQARTITGWATVDEGQGRGHAAAGPALRRLLGGDPAFRGKVVTVSKGGASIRVRLTDFCGCGDRYGEDTIIDLDETDFRTLTGRGPGIAWVRVTVGRASAGQQTAPPTDIE